MPSDARRRRITGRFSRRKPADQGCPPTSTDSAPRLGLSQDYIRLLHGELDEQTYGRRAAWVEQNAEFLRQVARLTRTVERKQRRRQRRAAFLALVRRSRDAGRPPTLT